MNHNPHPAIAEIGYSLLAELELERLLPKLMEQVLRHTDAVRGYVILKRGSRHWVVCEGRVRPTLDIQTRGKPLAQVTDISAAAIYEAEQTRRDIHRTGSGPHGGEQAGREDGVIAWTAPLLSGGQPVGFLYLTRDSQRGEFDHEAREFLYLLSPAMVLALANAMKFGQLNQRAREWKEALDSKPGGLAADSGEWSYEEAMARAKRASTVLHKLGNTLNCALLIGEDLSDRLEDTKLASFFKANEMLERHPGSRTNFLTEDPRGKLLPDFYLEVGHSLREERESLNREIAEINQQLVAMRELMLQYQTGASES